MTARKGWLGMLYYETLLTAHLMLQDRYARAARERFFAAAVRAERARAGLTVAAGAFLVHVGARLAGVRYEPVQPLSRASLHQ